MVLCFITKSRLAFLSKNFLKDDDYVPVMKESNIDVKALSNAYKEKKKIRDDSNVVKIGEADWLFPFTLFWKITYYFNSFDGVIPLVEKYYFVLSVSHKSRNGSLRL